MDLLGLRRAVKLPAAAPAIRERDLAELMLDTRRCKTGHEEVMWRGTPASACWVCDRPWSNC